MTGHRGSATGRSRDGNEESITDRSRENRDASSKFRSLTRERAKLRTRGQFRRSCGYARDRVTRAVARNVWTSTRPNRENKVEARKNPRSARCCYCGTTNGEKFRDNAERWLFFFSFFFLFPFFLQAIVVPRHRRGGTRRVRFPDTLAKNTIRGFARSGGSLTSGLNYSILVDSRCLDDRVTAWN